MYVLHIQLQCWIFPTWGQSKMPLQDLTETDRDSQRQQETTRDSQGVQRQRNIEYTHTTAWVKVDMCMFLTFVRHEKRRTSLSFQSCSGAKVGVASMPSTGTEAMNAYDNVDFRPFVVNDGEEYKIHMTWQLSPG